DPVAAAVAVGAEELDSRSPGAGRNQLVDLVYQPANPGLFHFLAAEWFGLLDANAAHTVHGLAPVFYPSGFELALSCRRCSHRTADVVEDAPAARFAVTRGGMAVAQVDQDFLHQIANEFVGDLHGVFPSVSSPGRPCWRCGLR